MVDTVSKNAPLMETLNGIHKPTPLRQKNCLSFLIIGAGSRGNAYASALQQCTADLSIRIGGIAEPVKSKRDALLRNFIRQDEPCEMFDSWQDFVEIERKKGDIHSQTDYDNGSVDGVFVCTLDETHAEIITALAPLGLHIMAEKPLATTLHDCMKIYWSLRPLGSDSPSKSIFSIGHVLRYSPHNMLLRKLLLEERIIGDIMSIEHTEPVGWWHFSHSYVRGNWRKESATAPSLLTKSCHDIDFLLWLLCSPAGSLRKTAHSPSYVSSTGSLLYFKKARKPRLAGDSTNCLACPAERECLYSAKRIYKESQLDLGNIKWPISVVEPEIEDLVESGHNGEDVKSRLLQRLAEDYDSSTSQEEIDRRPWFGRCVYESDNDVCDDQFVTITWEDSPLRSKDAPSMDVNGRGAKMATFHMVAWTEKQCERRGRVYGTKGEIKYDSRAIRIYDFATKNVQTHHPPQPGGGHGGGDVGLTQQFVRAIEAVKTKQMSVYESQEVHIGCQLEEILMSHAMVFAAEEARKEKNVVEWSSWYADKLSTRG